MWLRNSSSKKNPVSFIFLFFELLEFSFLSRYLFGLRSFSRRVSKHISLDLDYLDILPQLYSNEWNQVSLFFNIISIVICSSSFMLTFIKCMEKFPAQFSIMHSKKYQNFYTYLAIHFFNFFYFLSSIEKIWKFRKIEQFLVKFEKSQ